MLSDRELFLYITTNLHHALVLENISKETKTRILIKLVEKHCPKLKKKDWVELFMEAEKLRIPLYYDLLNIVEEKDYKNIAEQHQKAFNYNNQDYLELAKRENIDLTRIKDKLK